MALRFRIDPCAHALLLDVVARLGTVCRSGRSETVNPEAAMLC